MCLPPECLHMLCVREFMAVPPSSQIPCRPGVRGHRGALYSRPAGPAQPCHPPAERESYPQTCFYTHTHRSYMPGKITRKDARMQDDCVGILVQVGEEKKAGSRYTKELSMNSLTLTISCSFVKKKKFWILTGLKGLLHFTFS